MHDLAHVLRVAGDAGVRVVLLGGGSNILVGDGGMRGLVVKLGREYEREHGLTQERRRARGGRPKRLSSEQQLLGFLQSVLRLAKPRFRSQVARLIQLLESEKTN